MAKKPPKPFRKPLPPRRYRRAVRDRIYLEADRAFLDDITTTDADARIVLARELTPEEDKRLRKLVKEARKNRGAVRTGKLVVLAILAAAVVVFNIVFRDRLVENASERLLTDLFAAPADLAGVSFRPVSGEISFDSLSVADADDLDRNLFSLGTGRLSIDTWQLVNRRVLIRDVTVSGLAFGTARDVAAAATRPVDGASPRDAGEGSREAADEGTGLGDLSFSSLGLPDTLDARAFVAEQYDLLETPEAVELIAAAGTDYVARWESELTALAAQGVKSADRVRELATTDFTAIRSVDEALRLLEETNDLARTTSSYVDTVRGAVGEATSQGRAIVETAATMPRVVQDDYARIRAGIPDVRTEGRDFLVGLVEPYLRERLGAWYDRIEKGYRLFERVRAQTEPARARQPRRTGTIVDFETRDYPTFAIEQLFASASGARDLELVLESVTSDPDLAGGPTRLSYRDVTGDEVLSIGAIVDRRSAAEVPLSLTVQASALPFTISRGLSGLGLESLNALTDLELGLVRDADDTASGTVDLRAGGIVPTGSPEPGSIGELVSEVLAGPDPLVARFSYRIGTDGAIALADGSTNLDERISGLVRERIDATITAFEQRVESELDALIGAELDSLDGALADVVDLQATADELLALATDREAAAAALQARAATAVDSLRAAVEAEARERLDAARAEAEAAAQAAAKAAAERAAAEAEDAVRDQVEGVRNRLNLPGF